jgi:putative intracellular protease/amidase
MNVCILYYDGFCEFEVAITASIFSKQNVFAAALEERVYVSDGIQRFLPDKTIAELDPESIDLFVIPGGDPSPLFENQVLRNLITELNKRGKRIAGICGGTFLMAKYGILDNRKCTGGGSGITPDIPYFDLFKNSVLTNECLVVDGNIITSMGQAYVEMAVELGRLMEAYESEEEIADDYKWLKNVQD